MLTKRILQLYNIHVSNDMLEGLCKGSVDKIFVIKLCEDNKMKYFNFFASVDYERFNTFCECYRQKIKEGKMEFQKYVKQNRKLFCKRRVKIKESKTTWWYNHVHKGW